MSLLTPGTNVAEKWILSSKHENEGTKKGTHPWRPGGLLGKDCYYCLVVGVKAYPMVANSLDHKCTATTIGKNSRKV